MRSETLENQRTIGSKRAAWSATNAAAKDPNTAPPSTSVGKCTPAATLPKEFRMATRSNQPNHAGSNAPRPTTTAKAAAA